jgi:hypothetical protein
MTTITTAEAAALPVVTRKIKSPTGLRDKAKDTVGKELPAVFFFVGRLDNFFYLQKNCN